MPPDQPLHKPVQDLRWVPPRERVPAPPRVFLARLITFGGAVALASIGTYEMVQVVSAGGVTLLEGAMTALFALTFAWIAFAASSALAGLLSPPPRHRLPDEAVRLASRTALVMPIYHEDPAATTAALEAMARGLAARRQAGAFEIVILSDSTDADSWVAETVAVDRLRKALSGIMPVWYRRRWVNAARKAGNIGDFVEHWGGRYDHFVVLDADSLMDPATLVALAAAMEAEPRLGILQTVPILAGGRTLFSRLQQFAARIHGPVVARGLAAWQGGDGNYWGHNAIIRTTAFAACCGLPELPGREPLGGPILSHDFVEAALMRRAGWRVEMAADLGGSWEESPPSLIDAATRDRRWAQGNLQHLKVIAARGLAWPSRVHLAIGIVSYCASSLWLVLIVLGFALTLQAQLGKPEYFPEGFQLFPTWPLFDSERMTRLFIATMGVLFLPKAIGLLSALASKELRRGAGGTGRLVASAIVELLLSALYAPIMMLVHTRHLHEILTGRDSGWAPQRRDGGETRWAEAWRRHRSHMAIGVVTAAAAWIASPMILAWLSPCLIGLALAAPLSRASGSCAAGRALRRAGILATPEETSPPPILEDYRRRALLSLPLPRDGVLALVTDPAVREAHYRWVRPVPRRRGAPDATYLTASEKIADAETLEEALAWLDKRERVHVAGDRALVDKMLLLPRAPTVLRETPQPAVASGAMQRRRLEHARGALAVLFRRSGRRRALGASGHPA